MIRWMPVFLSLLCAPAWAQTAEPRIIGGDAAPADRWPWMAQVNVFFPASNEVGLCGGIHLARDWVATAAHCVVNENDQSVTAGAVQVRLGSVVLNGGSPPYNGSELYIASGFQLNQGRKFDNDIALVRISGPAMSERPSLIGDAQFQDLQNRAAAERDEALTALGWGSTQPGRTEDASPSTLLQEVQLDYVRTDSCLSQWGSGNFNTDTMVCADELNPPDGQQQDTCVGDSGGPLFIGRDSAPYIVGLTSYGQTNCADDLPSVYTNLASQIGFVEAATADAGDPLVDLALENTGERLYAPAAGTLSRTLTLANRGLRNSVTGATISATENNLDVTLDGQSCALLSTPCYTSSNTLGTTLINRAEQVELTASYNGLATPARATLTLDAGADQEEYRDKNNRHEITLIFSDQADLSVSGQVIEASRDGDGQGVAEVRVTVSNLSTVSGATASQVAVSLSLPAGTTVRDSSVPCDTVCSPGNLAPGASTEFTVTLATGTAQAGTLGLSVDANGGDFPTDNNDDAVALSYSASADTDSGGGGGGGGGTLGLAVLMLALAGALRHRD
ncbi:Serine endopeptidase/trypsin-like serine proteinase family protein [Alcanivorax sp. 521-1]|uniref:Serine endopeptidase/trypsin-like serine proteinase family protein n=1 Tax=Alloalcanivorax profundimaris TaxID=2735259 RepID=A0ABS0ATW4_9GAMM|nr:trypsin-like serine protease [Alloalcanivorax profundimaris]MBF5057572.1 Serine endopeptidase/trypsin-like serine proteinase family protein [Alloalcanivorax profundimaris]